MTDFKLIVETYERNAKNLILIAKKWNTIDDELRSFYRDELLMLSFDAVDAVHEAKILGDIEFETRMRAAQVSINKILAMYPCVAFKIQQF